MFMNKSPDRIKKKKTFDNKKRFTLRFSKNNETKKVPFSTKKDYFITITMKKHMKIQKLPQIFKAIIDKGIDVGFNLNKISYITDTRGWKEIEKTINIVKTRRKLYTNKTQFYDTDEKKNKTVSLYSPYKHFISERL